MRSRRCGCTPGAGNGFLSWGGCCRSRWFFFLGSGQSRAGAQERGPRAVRGLGTGPHPRTSPYGWGPAISTRGSQRSSQDGRPTNGIHAKGRGHVPPHNSPSLIKHLHGAPPHFHTIAKMTSLITVWYLLN